MTMKDEEQYEKICSPEFKKINDKLDDMHRMLFVGNGSPSLKSRIETNEFITKGMLWVSGVLFSAIITVLITKVL